MTRTVTIKRNQKLKVTIPAALRLSNAGLEKKGLRIETDQSGDAITVFAMNRVSDNCGGYMALPTNVLGQEYFVKSYRPDSTDQLSE